MLYLSVLLLFVCVFCVCGLLLFCVCGFFCFVFCCCFVVVVVFFFFFWGGGIFCGVCMCVDIFVTFSRECLPEVVGVGWVEEP